MINKPLDAIEEADLSALTADRRIEDRTIEYKFRLPDGADDEERKRNRIAWLWKPVASFANTDGGDLLFGITANAGIPNIIGGIEANDVDRTKLELENLVKSGIEPRIRLAGIRAVRLHNGNNVFIVRVPRGWSGPHRVIANAQFYYRTSAGALEMDIATLRREFLLSDSILKKISDFRSSRLDAISIRQQRNFLHPRMPAAMRLGARMVAHVIPIGPFAALPPMRLLRRPHTPAISARK